MLRAAVALLGATLAVTAVGGAGGPDRFTFEVRPVPLNPVDPAQEAVGELRYRGGLWLSASDPRFGGLSDLRVDRDGAGVIMVSDCGYVLRATLVYDGRGFLSGLRDAELEPLRAPGGRRLRSGEEDAESLALDGNGGYVVGFERMHRLWRYPDARRPLHGKPINLPVPPGLRSAHPNMALEAIARLADGRLLLIEEGQPGRPDATRAWAGSGSEWCEWRYPLFYDAAVPEEPFRPTSAALLPDGGVLVLERRYPPVAARVRRLDPASLEHGIDLTGGEIARLDPPVTLDNYEGIDVRTGERGETLVYVLSDDNNCRKLGSKGRPSSQRTLLLLFALSS
jgi:hypothetical protein